MNENSILIRSIDKSLDIFFILKYRIVVLIGVLILTGIFSYQLKHLKMPDDPMVSMYPADHRFLPALNAISELAPNPSMLVCLLEVNQGDIYNSETIKKIDAVTNALMNIKGISPSGITSLTKGFDHYNNTAEGLNIEPILGRKWPETKDEFQKLKRKVVVNPMGLGRYVSYDGTTAMITADFDDITKTAEKEYHKLSDMEKENITLQKFQSSAMSAFNTNLIKQIHELKSKQDDANHTLHFMGQEVITAEMTRMGIIHISFAAGIMMIVIIVFLAFYFKSVQGVVIPIIAMIVSVLLGLGMYSAAGFEFHPMPLLFPMILGLLSLGFSVLIVRRYYVNCDRTKDQNSAIISAFHDTQIAIPILTAGLITLCLCFTDVPMMQRLGYLGFFWLAGTFTAVVLLTPVMISFFSFPGNASIDGQNVRLQKVSQLFSESYSSSGKKIMVFILILLIITSGFSMKNLSVGGNVPGFSYIRSTHPWNQCFNLMAEKFMGPFQLLVYVEAKTKGGLLDSEAMNAISGFSSYLKSECGARDTIAFDMMIQLARLTLMDGNPKWQTVPVSNKKIESLAGMVMEQGGVESFMDKTYTRATISPFFPEWDVAHIDQYVSKMQDHIDSHPSDKVEFSLGGGLLGMTKALNDSTKDSYMKILAIAFMGILVLGIFSTGSLLLSLIVMLPLVAAQAIFWIILVVTGTPVNLPMVVIAAVVIGFGFMFGYHILQRILISEKEAVGDSFDLGKVSGSAAGEALFIGILVFAATLPWFFIGMKFPSDMLVGTGSMIILETFASIIFVPVLAGILDPEL